LVTGKSMMICEFTLDAGVEIPGHAHPHEQVVMWHQERCESPLVMKGSSSDRGDSYYVPSGVRHGAQVLKKGNSRGHLQPSYG
jgi:quercetin dioxygenase-like cupin family protein